MSAPRFPMAIYWWLLGLIVLIGILPLLTTLFAVGIAEANGCTISESVLTPCMIGGADWGYWLQFGGISAFYLLLSFPLAFLIFIVWLIVLLIHRGIFRRRVMA
jgi:putative solute:sodium symporter small subunit